MKQILAAVVVALGLSCRPVMALSQQIPGQDDFESYAVGTTFEGGAGFWGDSNTTPGDATRSNTVEVSALDGNPNNQVVHIVDQNTANGKNTHLRTAFWATDDAKTSGTYTVTFDVMPLQTDGPFKITMTDSRGWTSAYDWIAAIAFGSTAGNSYFTNSWNPSPIPAGNFVIYQTKRFQGAPNKRYDEWVNTGLQYAADTWYTVKFVVNVDSKTFDIAFGLHGGSLQDLVTGQPWVTGEPNISNDPTDFRGIYVATSNVTGEGAELLLDNVKVDPGPAPSEPATVAEAKITPINSLVRLSTKVVTAGSSQLPGPYFYVQDDTGGIRVRTAHAVQQGDIVSVLGYMQRASDNGTTVKRNGEKEILAFAVDDAGGPSDLPDPVGIRLRDVGAGDFGVMEPDTDGNDYISQPAVWTADTVDNKAVGLSNVGRYGRFWGRVLYVNDLQHFFYMSDGSPVIDGSETAGSTNPQEGVRVRVPDSMSLLGMDGAFVSVRGIVGAVSAAELGAPEGNINNVRIIRALDVTVEDALAN